MKSRLTADVEAVRRWIVEYMNGKEDCGDVREIESKVRGEKGTLNVDGSSIRECDVM